MSNEQLFYVDEIPGRYWNWETLSAHVQDDYGVSRPAWLAVFAELRRGQHVILSTDTGDILNISNVDF